MSSLTTLQIIFLVGGVSFAVIFLFGVGAVSWYVWRSKVRVDGLDKTHMYRAHWNNTLWIYSILIADAFGFLFLYMLQFWGQGVTSGVLWGRWILMIFVGFFNAYCLAYVMTTNSKDVASVSLVVTATLAYFVLWLATWVTVMQAHAWALTFSGAFFLASLLLYVYPFNKWTVEGSKYHEDIDGVPWGAHYHKAFYIVNAIVYIAYFIIWFLSTTNGLLTVISATSEAACFLVWDVVWVALLMVYMVVLTSTHMIKVFENEDQIAAEKRASPVLTPVTQLRSGGGLLAPKSSRDRK